MTASQETDRAHRAETPCGDLRPFAENTGGMRRCFARMRPGSFCICAFSPRAGGVVCSPECETVHEGGGSGYFDRRRMLRRKERFRGASPVARIRPRAEWMFRGAGAHENTLEVK